MKHEWKKHEKELYGVKQMPRVVEVSKQNYIMISGKGNPNDVDFSNRVEALFPLAHGIKMAYKAMAVKEKLEDIVHDFSVYPLEGIWEQKEGGELVKEKLEYTIMIRQPDFIRPEVVNMALEKLKKKKPNPLLSEIVFDAIKDGKCIEILHIGPFDDEPASFEKMDEFARQNGLCRIQSSHREIYLTNAKRVLKSKMQTILRYQVS